MRTLFNVLLALVATGCATQPPGPHENPVIVSLVGRGHTITIRHSSAGPIYTVQTADGAMLARDETIEALQAGHPDLYRLIQDTQATDARLGTIER